MGRIKFESLLWFQINMSPPEAFPELGNVTWSTDDSGLRHYGRAAGCLWWQNLSLGITIELSGRLTYWYLFMLSNYSNSLKVIQGDSKSFCNVALNSLASRYVNNNICVFIYLYKDSKRHYPFFASQSVISSSYLAQFIWQLALHILRTKIFCSHLDSQSSL